MNKNRVKGKTKEIEGRVLKGVGRVTGSRKTRVKGALREAEGKMQSALGRVQDAAEGTVRRTRGETVEIVPVRRTVRVRTTRVAAVVKKRNPERSR
jgi:uncharacterized protein YjbJ (UPF0337 family)